MGLCERRHAGLLTSWQADRQWFIEAFNGRFPAECLNAHWFLTLDDARSKMEDWRKYYNEVRPHGAIGNKPPITLQDYEGMPSSPS